MADLARESRDQIVVFGELPTEHDRPRNDDVDDVGDRRADDHGGGSDQAHGVAIARADGPDQVVDVAGGVTRGGVVAGAGNGDAIVLPINGSCDEVTVAVSSATSGTPARWTPRSVGHGRLRTS
ncbi:hypothetical protein [Stackebrandtia soli]|uniref:hypothetical protein n=1 Tax=Stackebrandtia soli TaxID=1892856 RepID=UPI0039E83729